MSELTRTLRRRIPDLVAVGVLLVGGLFFGVELLGWFRSPQAGIEAPPSALADLGSPGLATDMEFGDLPVAMTRMTKVGPMDEARTALAELLRESLPRSLPISTGDDAERNMLLGLSRRVPFEEQRGEWRMYGLDDRFSTMVVARPAARVAARPLRPRPPELAPGGAGAGDELAHTDLADWRIVGIGMLAGGLPQEAETDGPALESWTLYVLRGTAGGGVTSTDSPAIKAGDPSSGDWPRPEGSRRTMSVRDPSGGCLTVFQGGGSVLAVGEFYARVFDAGGYTPRPGWRNDARRVWGRFRKESPTNGGTVVAQVELLATALDGDRWSAILTETIARQDPSPDENGVAPQTP
jgi:hypothetical protein